MAIAVKENAVMCTTCNVAALTKKHYHESINRDVPDYYFEPWDDSDLHLYVCPKCKKEDFPS